jgi:3D (Asp-Asp-Asp) domain-containing protein
MSDEPQIDDAPFDLPEPTAEMKVERLTLWATSYHAYDAATVPHGQPLLDKSGHHYGPQLTDRDFCGAALEGTVRVTDTHGNRAVYNYDGLNRVAQVNCVPFYPHLPEKTAAELGRMHWKPAKGPFGDGIPGMILVPFRTIAVDSIRIPYGTVIYIPVARGKSITLPSGLKATHDGYFYAADAGGAIGENHIDVFAGFSTANPFPDFIKDNPAGTFEAFRINNSAIENALAKIHRQQTEELILEEMVRQGVSTNILCKDKAACIKHAAYDFVFRYYADPTLTNDKDKILKPDEAAALVAAGLKLGVCFQNGRSNQVSYFNRANGKRDGIYAYRYAQQMRQPAGSAIYFGLDIDPDPPTLPPSLAEHMEGVLEGFNSVSNNNPIYAIGLYGSGFVCATLKSRLSFIKYTWLAKPSGWHGREDYKGWDIKQFDGPGTLCGISGGRLGDWELNQTKSDNFGQFVPESPEKVLES